MLVKCGILFLLQEFFTVVVNDNSNTSVKYDTRKGDGYMIIDMVHNKGGVGKSTLSTNIAINLGADILDLDSLNACVLFNKIRKANGKNDLTVIQAETGQELIKILNEYKQSGKHLVIDSGGYDSEINRVAMLSSEILITPVSPSQIELFGLQHFMEILKESSKQLKTSIMTNVIINNADIRSKGDINSLKRFVKENNRYLDCFTTTIHSRKDFRLAYKMGLSVEELDKESNSSCEIRMFCREIRVL